jgi:hypothetical protein
MKDQAQKLPAFSGKIRIHWTEDEDKVLRDLLERYGTKKWQKIAATLNNLVHYGEAVRTPKACRERWVNRVNPNLANIVWTQDEDMQLLTQCS